MVIVSVTYPVSEGSRFDLDYYVNKHSKMLREKWTGMGMSDLRLIRGTGGLGGEPLAYHIVALLSFGSQQELDGALQAHGREIMADIKNYTNVNPTIQLNEALA